MFQESLKKQFNLNLMSRYTEINVTSAPESVLQEIL